MTAKELLIEALRAGGFDGLCYPDGGCGCLLDDLIPCGCDPSPCVPGHKRMNDDGDWIIEAHPEGGGERWDKT